MSSNMFEDVLTNASNMESEYVGPDYPYYKYVKTPSEIGMSSDGTLTQLGKDIDGLINYVELLVSGAGKASATGQPLGNKFFLKTGAKCNDTTATKTQDTTDGTTTTTDGTTTTTDGTTTTTDDTTTTTDGTTTTTTDTSTDQDRYIYISNVPAGNIPFISSGMGVNFSEFKGLIPGTISNLSAVNPTEIFQSFLAGSKPDCQPLTMETIDIYNNKSTETHFVTKIDIQNMDPCIFQDRTNPITGATCRETFTNLNQDNTCYTCYKIPQDPWSQMYFFLLGLLSVYILYRLLTK
jgi:hypothetical protein